MLVGNREDDIEECHEVLWVPVALAVPRDVDIEPGPLALPHLVIVGVSAARVELAMVISDKFWIYKIDKGFFFHL